MDPLEPNDDLRGLADEQLRRLEAAMEGRRPGTPVASIGVRPDRQPWTYRDIWRLAAIRAELDRRRAELDRRRAELDSRRPVPDGDQ